MLLLHSEKGSSRKQDSRGYLIEQLCWDTSFLMKDGIPCTACLLLSSISLVALLIQYHKGDALISARPTLCCVAG